MRVFQSHWRFPFMQAFFKPISAFHSRRCFTNPPEFSIIEGAFQIRSHFPILPAFSNLPGASL
jgi:hypothetical protein